MASVLAVFALPKVFELIRLAREQKKPIFGICRGFQVLNVAFGGSLY